MILKFGVDLFLEKVILVFFSFYTIAFLQILFLDYSFSSTNFEPISFRPIFEAYLMIINLFAFDRGLFLRRFKIDQKEGKNAFTF